MNRVINKGVGAGGVKTNYYGKMFEEMTNNEKRLIDIGYKRDNINGKLKNRYDYYLWNKLDDKRIIFVLQGGLKMYMKRMYDIELFRCPDEAYIIEYDNGRRVIKILEKKEQNVDGSVETKLWAGVGLKREYEMIMGDNFEIEYGYCVSNFLKNKFMSVDIKYKILKKILDENKIDVLYGEDDNYFETLDRWIYN
jgi:hypothetical protein